MSRTIGSIITLAGAIVVNVVPGLGQLASAAILLGSAALGYVVSSLGGQKNKAEQTSTSLKTERPARIYANGARRLYGASILYETSQNGHPVDVWAFSDSRLVNMIHIYLNDDKVTVSGNYVQGELLPDKRYKNNKVRVGWNVGLPTETAFPLVISEMSGIWTSNHRGDGVVTGFMIKYKESQRSYTKTYPQGDNIAMSIAGDWGLHFNPRDPAQDPYDKNTWAHSKNAAVQFLTYLIDKRALDWDTQGEPTRAIIEAALDDCDMTMAVSRGAALLTADTSPDAVHTLILSNTRGILVGTVLSIGANGKNSQSETRTVSGVAGNTVTISPEVSYYHQAGAYISWDSNPSNPATEPRYRGCLVYKSTDEPAAIISEYLACFDGWYCFNESNQLVLRSGRYYTPTVSIGPDEISSYSFSYGLPIEDKINEIKVTYISDLHDYSEVEASSWIDEDAIIDSGREPNSATVDPQTPSFTQNRRLAKRKMSRTNSPFRMSIVTTFGGRAIFGERYINVRLEEAGALFYNGPVEIITAPELDLMTGGVSFDCVAADPNIDAWNPYTEDGEGAPVGERVAREPLATPEINNAFTVFAESVDNAGTGVRIAIEIADLSLDGLTWYARWRKDTASVWNEQQYNDVEPDSGIVSLLTDFVPVDPSIYVEVSYRSTDGRYSEWSAPVIVDTRTDISPPDPAGVITLISWGDSLSLSTDAIPRASSYRWRFFNPSDTSTPIRSITTAGRTVAYTSAQAAIDGVRRDYIVEVAGVNAAGVGAPSTTSTLTNTAPSAVAGVSATGGATDAEIDFTLLTESDVAGYVAYTSTNTGFDPLTEGFATYNNGAPPFYLQGLAAATFYSKVAAYDAWSQNPGLLNFSSEVSFTITTGGGGTGGGGGGGGGGYCPEVSTLVLLANDAENGPGEQIPAGDIAVGMAVWTRPELEDGSIGQWGAHAITAIDFVDDVVYKADIGVREMRATADHRLWIGRGWVKMRDIGVADGMARVAKITVASARTYIANGLLNHNIKDYEP